MKHQAMHKTINQARECLLGVKSMYYKAFKDDTELMGTGIGSHLSDADTAIWNALDALRKAQGILEQEATR